MSKKSKLFSPFVNPRFDGSVARVPASKRFAYLEICFNPCFDGSVARVVASAEITKLMALAMGMLGFKLRVDQHIDPNIENLQRAMPPIEPGAPSGFAAMNRVIAFV